MGAGLAILALLGSALPVYADPVLHAPARSEAERSIVATVHEWFALLEDRDIGSRDLADFPIEREFEFLSPEGVVRRGETLRSWLSERSSLYPEFEYRVGTVRVEPTAEELYRVRLEFDLRSLDRVGMTHIARAEQTWLVRHGPDGGTSILRIEEHPLLAFPGTGPRIVCY